MSLRRQIFLHQTGHIKISKKSQYYITEQSYQIKLAKLKQKKEQLFLNTKQRILYSIKINSSDDITTAFFKP